MVPNSAYCEQLFSQRFVEAIQVEDASEKCSPYHAGDDLAIRSKTGSFYCGYHIAEIGICTSLNPVIEASYRVSQCIAELKKAQTIAEELV